MARRRGGRKRGRRGGSGGHRVKAHTRRLSGGKTVRVKSHRRKRGGRSKATA